MADTADMADHAPEGRVAAGPAPRAMSGGGAPARGLLATVRRQAAGGGGPALGVWVAVVCAGALGVAGLVGILLHQPWLFPSLGPTVLVLLETPGQPAAHPRHVLVGHVVAVAAGYLALVVTGLRAAPSVLQAGLDGRFVVSAMIALAVTALVLQLLRLPHSPAGATTLVVGLGILKTPGDLVVIVLAVVLVTLIASAANVAARVRQTGVTDAPRRTRA
jgi:HPP family